LVGVLIAISAGFSAGANSVAQAPCAPLAPYAAPAGEATLSPQQAGWLYQLEVAEAGGSWNPIADPSLAGEVQQVAARLQAHLPAGTPPVEVEIITAGVPNALTLPGGHVLIPRPLISLLRNEDELAGVLAHEVGHIYTEDDERSFAAYLRGDLGLSDFGANQNAFADNYQRWITWRERHDSKVRNQEDERQSSADSVAIELLRLAGYDPHGLPDGFDRLIGTHGDTGNWFSNFFGTTNPDAKRLRAMVQSSAAAGCAAAAATPLLGDTEFQTWQQRLVGYQAPPGPTSLPGLISTQKLDPLHDVFRELKFSPDGKHILGRNAAGLWVLSVQPLALELHVEEPTAVNGEFTPDSSAIVFSTSDGRVERWALASKSRTLLRQVVPALPGCAVALPSPDGASLACERGDGRFQLFEVATGAVRFEHKADAPLERLKFSPDARYLVVADRDHGFAVDLDSGKQLELGSCMNGYLNRHFSFISPSLALGSDDPRGIEWHQVSFPSGKEHTRYRLADDDIVPETQGGDVIVRPMKLSPAGMVDPVTRKAVVESGSEAFDGYGDLLVNEGKDGSINLERYSGAKPDQIARLALPTARLIGLNEGQASPDLRLLAISEERRGAVWDLLAQRQLSPIEGFRRAWFDGTNVWMQFNPPRKPSPVWMAEGGMGAIEEFDLLHGSKRALPAPPKGEFDVLDGWVTLVTNPGGKSPRTRWVLEARDTASGKSLWTKQFETKSGIPAEQVLPSGQGLLLAYPFAAEAARKEAAADPAWRAAAAAVKDTHTAVWFDLEELQSGNLQRSMLLDAAPSLALANAVELDGLLYLNDGYGRTLAYELATGKLRQTWFGNALERIPSIHAIVLHTGPRELAIVAAGANEPRQRFEFPENVVYAQASADGQRLLVVTLDQTAYILQIGL